MVDSKEMYMTCSEAFSFLIQIFPESFSISHHLWAGVGWGGGTNPVIYIAFFFFKGDYLILVT